MAERPSLQSSTSMTDSEVRERYRTENEENIPIKKEPEPISDEDEDVFTDYDLFEGYPPGKWRSDVYVKSTSNCLKTEL